MRIAHIADVHLDRPFAGLAGAAGDRARQRLRDTFRGCLAVAAERNVDLITIGGDLWEEENVRFDTRRFVSGALAATGTPVLMICGNHDPYLPGGNYPRTEWPENVFVFSSATPTERKFDGGSVWGVSWTGERLDASFLDSFEAPGGQPHILLIHGTGQPIEYLAEKSNHCPFSPGAVRDAGFDLCLAGHIHSASYRDGVVYPGSPEPLGWSETGDHCIAIVDIGREIEVDLIDVNDHRYDYLEVDCTGCDSSAAITERLAAALPGTDTECLHLRVELSGEIDAGCEVNPVLFAEGAGAPFAELVVVDSTTPAYDLDHLAGQETVKGIFVRELTARIEAAADEGERERLELALIAGLRALDGREDVVRVG